LRGLVTHNGKFIHAGKRWPHGVPNLPRGSEVAFDLSDGEVLNLRVVRHGKPEARPLPDAVHPREARIVDLPGEDDYDEWDKV
jgi:hypothetical protein